MLQKAHTLFTPCSMVVRPRLDMHTKQWPETLSEWLMADFGESGQESKRAIKSSRLHPRDAQRDVPVKGSGSKTFFVAFVVSAMNKRVL
jgi:hypothetical protein